MNDFIIQLRNYFSEEKERLLDIMTIQPLYSEEFKNNVNRLCRIRELYEKTLELEEK